MSYRSVTEIADCDREISVGGPLHRLDGHTAALSVTRERVWGDDADLGVADGGDVGLVNGRAPDQHGLNKRRIHPGALDGKLVPRIDTRRAHAGHHGWLQREGPAKRQGDRRSVTGGSAPPHPTPTPRLLAKTFGVAKRRRVIRISFVTRTSPFFNRETAPKSVSVFLP
jgi:hypothetical protein